MSSKRFGNNSLEDIDLEIKNLTPLNTKKSKASCWKQFMEFCNVKWYVLSQNTTISNLALILKDFAFNMKKQDGTDYKERVVKTLWNTVAKMLLEKYKLEYNILFDPFKDAMFDCARKARDAKRKQLQTRPEKRKSSAKSMTVEEYGKILEMWDEDTPEGLQRKFYHIAAVELAWRGGEAATALVSYFIEEKDNSGNYLDRIMYNPLFGKTAQGGAQRLEEKKWLIRNVINPKSCPVRLFRK